MTDGTRPIAEDRAAIRKRGLVTAGVGLGGIVLGRALVELEIALGVGSPMVAGVMIPLVVVLALLLIALAFYVVIPNGYRLAPH